MVSCILRPWTPWHRSLRCSAPHYRSISTEQSTKDALRLLLRETAQPVAVVTSVLPIGADDTELQSPRGPVFHGATLSSFASVAFDPHPLVAFSLRIPSRMARALKALQNQNEPSMVVNILSSTQADTAIRFSRPDLHPEPFRDKAYALTKEGLPALRGCLGSLSCSLVSCLPLQGLCDDQLSEEERASPERGVLSELFISRVVRVERLSSIEVSPEAKLPLLYHRRRYATAKPVDGATSSR